MDHITLNFVDIDKCVKRKVRIPPTCESIGDLKFRIFVQYQKEYIFDYKKCKQVIYYRGEILRYNTKLADCGILNADGDDFFYLKGDSDQPHFPDPKIKGLIWDDERRETGRYLDLSFGGGAMFITNRRVGFQRAIKNTIVSVIQDLYKIIHLDESDREKLIRYHAQKYIQVGFLSDISRIKPQIYGNAKDKLRNELLGMVIDSVIKFATEDPEELVKIKLGSLIFTSDSDFLALLQRNRDYKEGCAICLTDEIMGTTCGCGHTEIVVFRPCGHSVCCSPCFTDLCSSKGIELKHDSKYMDQTIKDVYSARGFECLICRTDVRRCFRAERIQLEGRWDKEVDRLTELLLNYSYSIC